MHFLFLLRAVELDPDFRYGARTQGTYAPGSTFANDKLDTAPHGIWNCAIVLVSRKAA
jgi:hypothetical protein